MAVTQDSFTGNGTKTDYDFTFPYLKQSEIKASLDGTATTNFRFLTATKIQFVNNTTANTPTAPASGVKIKIFRETDSATLAATFYAGSAIKSEDLNDNFTQNLYAVQEVSERYLSNLGGTMTGDLNLGEDVVVKFEGATDNAHETTLTVVDPTADRTITLPNETGTVITTASTGQVATSMIAGDAVNGDKIADNAINSEHYTDGSIDTAHIADAQITTAKILDANVTTAKIADANITTAKIADSNVTTAKIAADAVNGTKIADDSINSEHYVDGSIDTAHIADSQITSAKIADATIVAADLASNAVTTAKITDANVTTVKIADSNVTTAKIADNAVTTSKITDANITTAKLADNAVTTAKITDANVTTAKIADSNVTTAKIADDNVTTAKIPDNAITTAKIADAELTTLAGMQSGTASILAGSTALTATTDELNLLDNKSFRASGDGALTTTSDTEIPSSKVVANHVAAQLGTVGGFTTIATEVAFPATASQPANGVIISISDAAGIVVNGSGVSTTGRTTDGTPATVTINSFPSSLNGETLASGVGLLVTSTGSGNTYTYHKLLAAESDVKQLSDDINDFNARYRVAGSAPGSNNDAGDLYFDTGANKMKVYNGTTSTWDDVASVGNFFINTISSSSGTGGGSATFNGSAYRFTLSNAPTMAQQLIVSINGVIQKPDAGSSQPSEGFAISGNDIIFSAAPASGSDYFIVTQGSSVSIGTPSDNTVSTAKIQNLGVTTAKIAANAVTNAKITDDTIAEVKLDVHNAPATGKYLKYTSNGMEWSDGASEGTDVKSTGESGTTKFLRTDGDGTSSWQVPPSYTHPNHSGEVTSSADGAQTIASNVVDEDNLKVSNSPTNGQFLQAQSGNTGGLTWANVSAAPEVEAVASGTLATDDAVFFNVSGTVSKVTLTSVSDSVGSSVDARGGASNSVSQWEFDSCRISDTTFAICWEKDGIKVVVGTISGTSISFGTILNTGNGTDSGNDFPLIDYCAKSGCLALAYKNGSDLSMRAISVSGNSLTEGSQATRSLGGSNSFGTTFALACGNSRYGAAGPMTGGLVFGRKSTGDDTYLYDFSISGNTVTIGANRNELNKKNDISQVFRSTNIIYCPLRDAYVVAYVDETYSGSPYLWMDSYTRGSNNAAPTFKDNGGPLAAASMSTTICSLAYDSEHQNIAVAFNDNNNHTKIRKINFQSNYDLSDYDPVQFESGGSAVINWLSLVYQRELGEFYCLANNTTDGRVDLFRIETNSNGTELSYPSDSSHRTNSIVSHNSDKITLAAVGNGTIVTTIPSSNAYQVNSTARQYAHTSKNVTPSVTNFLGFSAGNYTNGQTAKIKIVGNTTTQSSLSPMTTYYITDTGTVSSTEGNPSIKAGYAISSTKMIITPQYMY